MANTPITSMPAEYQTGLDDAERKKRLAMLMLEGSMRQRPAGQRVGRFYVPDSPFNALADVIEQRRARSDISDAEKERAGVIGRYQADENKGVADIIAAATAQPKYGAADVGPTMEIPDTTAALQAGAASRFPRVQNLTKTVMDQRKAQFDAAARNATPESIQRGATSGMDPRHLIPQAPDTFTNPELMPGAPGPDGSNRSILTQRNTRSNEVKRLDSTPAPGTSLTVDAKDPLDASKQQRELNAQTLKMLGDDATKRNLRDIPQRTRTAMKALEILNEGNLNVGTGAGFLTALQKVGGLAGFNVDPKATENDVYDSFIKGFLPQLLQGFAPISEGEVKMAIEQLPNASKTPGGAKRILVNLIENAISQMGDYNTRVEQTGQAMGRTNMDPGSAMPYLIPFGPYQRAPGAESELFMKALERLKGTPQNLPPEYQPAPARPAPSTRPPRRW